MKRFATYLALLLLSLFVASACGGSGGGASPSDFPGEDKLDFTSGGVPDAAFLLPIPKKRNTGLVIFDATGVLYEGTGTTTATGHATGTATGVAPTVGTVTIVGDVTAGDPPTMAATMTGAVADSVSLVQVQPQGITPLVGTFNGSYFGD